MNKDKKETTVRIGNCNVSGDADLIELFSKHVKSPEIANRFNKAVYHVRQRNSVKNTTFSAEYQKYLEVKKDPSYRPTSIMTVEEAKRLNLLAPDDAYGGKALELAIGGFEGKKAGYDEDDLKLIEDLGLKSHIDAQIDQDAVGRLSMLVQAYGAALDALAGSKDVGISPESAAKIVSHVKNMSLGTSEIMVLESMDEEPQPSTGSQDGIPRPDDSLPLEIKPSIKNG